MVLRVHVVLCVTALFLKIRFLLQKWGKSAKNEPKIRFCELIENFVIVFFPEFGP